MSTAKNVRPGVQSLTVPSADYERHHSLGNIAIEEVRPHTSTQNGRNRLSSNGRLECEPQQSTANKSRSSSWSMRALKQVFVDTADAKSDSEIDLQLEGAPVSENFTSREQLPSQSPGGILRRRQSRKSVDHTQSNAPQRRIGIGNWISEAAPRVWTNFSKNTEHDASEETQTKPVVERKRIVSIAERDDSRLRYDPAKHRRATVHYSSTGRPSVMMGSKRLSTLRAAHLAKEDRALEQIKDVCRDYILYRLRRKSYANKVKLSRLQQTNNRWIIEDSLFVVNELEQGNKHLFRNISKQVGITLRSEDVLRKVFSELAIEILTTEEKMQDEATENESCENVPSVTAEVRKTSFSNNCPRSRTIEITWGRIFAIIAIAGGLAVDCVQQGHSDLVNCLIEFCGEIIHEEGVLSWIVSEGGLEALHKVAIEDDRDSWNNADYGYFTRLCNAALAFGTCAVAAVFAVALIGSILNTFT